MNMYKIIGADNKEYGPIPLDVLKQWINEGRVNGKTLVMAEGEQYWRQLSSVPELAVLLPPGQGGGMPFQTPPYYASAAPQEPKQNGMALASFICGLLSIFLCMCCGGFPFNVLGIIFGILGLNQINSTSNQTGKGMAIAGIILGAFSLVIMLISTIAVFTSKELQDMILQHQRMLKI